MTAPIFDPDTTTKPAKPRRNRLWAVAAVLLAVALAGGAALYAATRGGDTSTAQPSPTPTATPTSDATPSPTPSTSEAQSKAEIQTLVADYYAITNALYASTSKSINAVEQHTRGELREYRIQQHQYFRNSGQTITGGEGLIVHSVQVTDVNLAGDPPSAVVSVCSSGNAVGIGANGQPTDFTLPRTIVTYDAQYRPSVVGDGSKHWFLVTQTGTDQPC